MALLLSDAMRVVFFGPLTFLICGAHLVAVAKRPLACPRDLQVALWSIYSCLERSDHVVKYYEKKWCSVSPARLSDVTFDDTEVLFPCSERGCGVSAALYDAVVDRLVDKQAHYPTRDKLQKRVLVSLHNEFQNFRLSLLNRLVLWSCVSTIPAMDGCWLS